MPESKGRSATGAPGKMKRTRVNFTSRQLEALEKVFAQSQYPDVTVLETLAERMGLAIEKVCTWFQNRRSKFRKESKKGHIDWMRQQLFAEKAAKLKAEAPSGHVLTPTPGLPTPSTLADLGTVRYPNPSCSISMAPRPVPAQVAPPVQFDSVMPSEMRPYHHLPHHQAAPVVAPSTQSTRTTYAATAPHDTYCNSYATYQDSYQPTWSSPPVMPQTSFQTQTQTSFSCDFSGIQSLPVSPACNSHYEDFQQQSNQYDHRLYNMSAPSYSYQTL